MRGPTPDEIAAMEASDNTCVVCGEAWPRTIIDLLERAQAAESDNVAYIRDGLIVAKELSAAEERVKELEDALNDIKGKLVIGPSVPMLDTAGSSDRSGVSNDPLSTLTDFYDAASVYWRSSGTLPSPAVPTPDTRDQTIADLLTLIGDLEYWLQCEAEHGVNCPGAYTAGKPCTCGLRELLERLEARE